jgi:hypothetical protein
MQRGKPHEGGVRAQIRVRLVRPGSLEILFLLEVTGLAQSLNAALPNGISSAVPILKLLREWFELLMHLGGKPPTNVQKVNNSPGVNIQNASGKTRVFQQNVYNTFNFHGVGRFSEQVARPLKRRADWFEIRTGKKLVVRAKKRDINAFRSVRRIEPTLENVSEVYLKVISPVFEGSAAWRFSRGRNIITATVADPDFLSNVQTGQESFRAGDILRVRLRSIQEKVGNKIRDHHVLEEVLSHEGPGDLQQARIAGGF